jgi:hypothetical protein
MTIDSQIIAAVIAAGAALVVPGFSAFLGVRLAMRQHRSQQWFDRKMATYAAIFEALNELSEEIDQLLDEEMNKPTVGITPGHRMALAKASAKARLQLRKASRIGAL